MAIRDYSNMPEIDLSDETSIRKAKVQILHQEPVILNLPDAFEWKVRWDEFSCSFDEEKGIHFDCDGGDFLAELSKTEKTYDFAELSKACSESGSQIDIDVRNNRIIFHD